MIKKPIIIDYMGFFCYNIDMGIHIRAAKLEAENIQLKSENAKYASDIAALAAENARLSLLIERFSEQLRLAKHRRFGASTEVSVMPEQLGLFNEAEMLTNEQTLESETEQITYTRKKKSKGKRDELYDGLPTKQIVHELPPEERICPDCGEPLHACGHEVLRKEVVLVPAQVYAEEHVQTVYACRNCEQNSDADALSMVKAPVPAPVIPGSGIASPSLLAYILCNKYVLALPFYRQEQELQRLGIYISRQTMSNWCIYVADHWLILIYAILHPFLLQEDIAHGDETTTQVIKEDGRTAAQKSYMWVFTTGAHSEHPITLFEYQPSRSGKHPVGFLEGFKGFLHTDAYSGYLKLTERGVILVRCWSHVRRKFDEALKALPKEERAGSPANVGLDYCNRLFKLEREFDDLGISLEERAKRRETESKPIAEAFFAWVESTMGQVASGNKLWIALQYANNQKSTLMNFLLDPRLELSNNRAERVIRPFAVGRKNWLFFFCAQGAKSSAIIYSIIETALANGLVPFLYLEFLFRTLPNIPAEQYADCLPWSPQVQALCAIPKSF